MFDAAKDRLGKLLGWGIGIKIALLLGGPTIVLILAFIWHNFFVGAFHTLTYILSHSHQIFK